MPLPFKVDTLDKVPEAQRELYAEAEGGGYVLDVEGAEGKDEVGRLRSALAKTERALAKAKEQAGKVTDDDLEELERLREAEAKREEEKAAAEGKWDELRAKLVEKHEKDVQKMRDALASRDKAIETLTVKNELMSALDGVGVHPDYKRAAFLELMDRRPTVDWPEGEELPVGIFADEVEGNKPISEFVKSWAESDDASPYMPPETGGGGGGSGETSRRGTQPSWHGKKFSEMTEAEQIEYTNQRHAEGAYNPRTAAA